MKTVAQLIDFLQTQNPEMPIQELYDGIRSEMYVFQDRGMLWFGNARLTEDYENSEVLFVADRIGD